MAVRSSSLPLPDSRSSEGCVEGLTASIVAATGTGSVGASASIFDGEGEALSAEGTTSGRSPDRDQAAVSASATSEDDLVEWLRSKARASQCVLAVSGGGYSGTRHSGESVNGCVMVDDCASQPWSRSGCVCMSPSRGWMEGVLRAREAVGPLLQDLSSRGGSAGWGMGAAR